MNATTTEPSAIAEYGLTCTANTLRFADLPTRGQGRSWARNIEREVRR